MLVGVCLATLVLDACVASVHSERKTAVLLTGIKVVHIEHCWDRIELVVDGAAGYSSLPSVA